MIDNLKYFDGELADIPAIPDDLRQKYLTAFGIDAKWVIDSAGAPAEVDRPNRSP